MRFSIFEMKKMEVPVTEGGKSRRWEAQAPFTFGEPGFACFSHFIPYKQVLSFLSALVYTSVYLAKNAYLNRIVMRTE